MPFAAGVFTPVYNWQNDKANGIKIRADRMDGQDSDIATGLTTAMLKDGSQTLTSNIPYAGFKNTGMGAGSSAADSVRADQLQKNDLTYFIAGSTDGYDLTPSPPITAYTAGVGFKVKFTNANATTSPTINVSGLGVKSITKNGATALAIGDIAAGALLDIAYDGTRFQVVGSLFTLPSTVVNLKDQGTKTGKANGSFTFLGSVDSKLQVYSNTTAGFNLLLPGSATAHGRILMLVQSGSNPIFLCGTVNNIGGTVGLSGRQTIWITYNSTEGWV